jgi:ankyrin repeat protein
MFTAIILGGLADTVTFLLSKGADATTADMGAKTPLMLAASEGHAAIVQALLAHLSALGKGLLSAFCSFLFNV